MQGGDQLVLIGRIMDVQIYFSEGDGG